MRCVSLILLYAAVRAPPCHSSPGVVILSQHSTTLRSTLSVYSDLVTTADCGRAQVARRPVEFVCLMMGWKLDVYSLTITSWPRDSGRVYRLEGRGKNSPGSASRKQLNWSTAARRPANITVLNGTSLYTLHAGRV
ncbi:hypothetical protein J6590_031442 [Homalodisca vitripennis]|nr:hypothetical protein J6590_031442 [Homalodisca vitripennis]